MDRVDYYSVGMIPYDSVWDPYCISLLSLCLFLQGEKGTPGEQVSHTITGYSSYCTNVPGCTQS